MSTRSVAWVPRGGWDGFADSIALEELLWEMLAGWHYLDPTVNQSVWESPMGATVFVAFDSERSILELVLGHVEADEPELEELRARLRQEFRLAPAGS